MSGRWLEGQGDGWAAQGERCWSFRFPDRRRFVVGAVMTRLAEVAAFVGKLPFPPGSGLRFAQVRMFGVRAGVVVSVNDGEWRRRERVGLGGVTGLDVLDGLLGLPLGVPVAVQALTGRERRLVNRLPEGVVEQRDGVLVRWAEPVVEVALAVVFARSWSTGLVAASVFASYCARLMVLRSRPVDEVSVGVQASYYGVGVAVVAGDDHLMLVAPEPVADRRVTAAGWWFAEEIYQQLRTGAGLVDLATVGESPRP
jgi:hypothetical protein